MQEERSLAEVWVDFMRELPEGVEYSWDDFFEIVGVPKEDRSDFLVAAIIKQAQEKLGVEVEVEREDA